MKTKIILAVAAAIALIVACQKETEEPEIVKVYEQNSVERLPIKLLTRNGEISDTSIINSFINRYHYYFFYPIAGNTYVVASYPIRIEYRADEKVNFIKDNKKSCRSVITENGVVYFESKEITEFIGYKETSYYKLTKYRPYWMESHTISDTSKYEATDFKHCYFATVSGNDLILPFFAYIVVRDNPDNPYYYGSVERMEMLNNAFGGVPENYLGYKDTLLIQESRVTLKLR